MTVPVDVVHEPARAIEAVLMVATEPVTVAVLAQLVEQPADKVAELCEGLAEAYATQERGFVLVEVAGGWRFQSHPDLAPYIERYVLEGQGGRLSAAALETLAIIAYKQPISRAQVAAIRGVSVDGVIRTLEQRGYITEVARDPGPGQAVLFGTTALFLEKLGLASLADLPPVAEFVPDASVVEQLEQGLRPVAPTAPVTLPTQDAPTQDAPTQDAPTEAASAHDAPAEAVVTHDAPVADAPTDELQE
jgi:segregation and condensation protein B